MPQIRYIQVTFNLTKEYYNMADSIATSNGINSVGEFCCIVVMKSIETMVESMKKKAIVDQEAGHDKKGKTEIEENGEDHKIPNGLDKRSENGDPEAKKGSKS